MQGCDQKNRVIEELQKQMASLQKELADLKGQESSDKPQLPESAKKSAGKATQ